MKQVQKKFLLLAAALFMFFQIEPRTGQRRFFSFSDDDTPDSEVYCKAQQKLYEQTDLIKTDYFKNASLKGKQDLLEKHFHAKQLEAYLAILKNRALNGSPYFVIALMLYLSRQRLPEVPNVAGLGLALALQDHLGATVKSGFSTASLIVELFKKQFMTEEAEDFFKKTELWYVRTKQDLPQEYQAIFERIFIESKCNPTWQEDHYTKMLQLARNLPVKNKELVYDNALVEETFVGYDAECQADLKRYCIRHVAACTATNVRKIVAYFHGEPGVGKTRAAHLMAEVLGVRLKKMSLAGLTIDALIGTEKEPGLLLSVLCHNSTDEENFKNTLLLIDDADRVLLSEKEYGLYSFLLTLLESETKTFYSPFLEAEIDISSLGIILAGNTDITDPALRSRLHIVYFKDYTNDYKKKVVWEELLQSVLAPHEKAALQLLYRDLTEEDRQAINELIENDTAAGFRELKLKLTKYIEDKVLSKYFA